MHQRIFRSSILYVGVFVIFYADTHKCVMGPKHDIPKLLRAMMEVARENQTELASRLSLPGSLKVVQPQISRWLKGQEPETANRDRILEVATDLGVLADLRSEDVAASIDAPPPKHMVKVKGYVGAGSMAHFYAVSDEDFEEVEALTGASDKTVAVEIRGKSFGPLMDSWLVFYDDVRSPVTEDLIGKACVIGLADDRIVLKEIQRNGRGGYRLLSNSGEAPIEDAVIEWAAPVTGMRPR